MIWLQGNIVESKVIQSLLFNILCFLLLDSGRIWFYDVKKPAQVVASLISSLSLIIRRVFFFSSTFCFFVLLINSYMTIFNDLNKNIVFTIIAIQINDNKIYRIQGITFFLDNTAKNQLFKALIPQEINRLIRLPQYLIELYLECQKNFATWEIPAKPSKLFRIFWGKKNEQGRIRFSI